MLTKILSVSSLGMLLGYISGYNLSYSAALIKLSILILLINLFFIKKAKQDLFFKNILILFTVFILFFIVSIVRGDIIKKDFENINIRTKLSIKVYDVTRKDNTQIIKGEILSNETGLKDGQLIVGVRENQNIKNVREKLILRNIAIYTFSQEKYEPGMYIELEGKVQNELIILPKKESETYFDQNSGRSFDLLKYWNTKNIDFVSMYPKVKILNKVELLNSKIENLNDETQISKINFLEKIKNEIQDFIFYHSYKFRNYFYESLKKTTDSFDSGIVMAMLWGDENNISRDTNSIFKNTGTSHILVLSGYNLIIVASLAAILFRKLSLRKKVTASVLFVIVFLLLAHTSSPVWRAGIMSLYTILTILFLRQSNAKFALWLTCFIFIFYSPVIAMHDVSFHLSFLATFGIIYFYPEIETFIKNKFFIKEKIFAIEKYKKWEVFISIILVTISANILIAPYLIFQFGYFKFSSIIFSALVTPFVPLIMLLGVLIGSINILVNIILDFNIYVLNIFSKLILIGIKFLSFILESILSLIFNFLKYFSNMSGSVSDTINFTTLIFMYIIIFTAFNFLVFINKNN